MGCLGRTFQFLDLLIEVIIEIAFHDSRMRFPDLVTVEVYKEDPDVVEEFVDPGKVEERLIDGLRW